MQSSVQGMKLTFFAFRQPGGDFEKSFRPAGFLSAQIKYVYTQNYTKPHLVIFLNQFSNIINFSSNKDILKI